MWIWIMEISLELKNWTLEMTQKMMTFFKFTGVPKSYFYYLASYFDNLKHQTKRTGPKYRLTINDQSLLLLLYLRHYFTDLIFAVLFSTSTGTIRRNRLCNLEKVYALCKPKVKWNKKHGKIQSYSKNGRHQSEHREFNRKWKSEDPLFLLICVVFLFLVTLLHVWFLLLLLLLLLTPKKKKKKEAFKNRVNEHINKVDTKGDDKDDLGLKAAEEEAEGSAETEQQQNNKKKG